MTAGAIIGTCFLALLIAIILFDGWVNRKMLSPQEETDNAEEHKNECLQELEETKRTVERQKDL